MAWLIKTSFLKHFLPLVSKALNPCDFLPIRLMSLLPGVLCCLLPTSPDAEHHCSWTPHLGSNSTPSPCPELRSLYGAFDVSCVLSSLRSRLHPPCLPEVQNCIFCMLTIITSNARHLKKNAIFLSAKNPNHILQAFQTSLAGSSTPLVYELQKQGLFP